MARTPTSFCAIAPRLVGIWVADLAENWPCRNARFMGGGRLRLVQPKGGAGAGVPFVAGSAALSAQSAAGRSPGLSTEA